MTAVTSVTDQPDHTDRAGDNHDADAVHATGDGPGVVVHPGDTDAQDNGEHGPAPAAATQGYAMQTVIPGLAMPG